MAGGVSLGRLVAEARLRPSLTVEIARQTCSALVEAHNGGIVHRDLKPDNLHLLVQSDGSFHAKLLDFGIAFPQEATTKLTDTGMMCGTATYMAPEQARGREVDGQADLYSLGIILFQMVTGVLPFQGDSGFEIIRQQVEDSPPDPTQ
ncbi:MAG: serine/threonine-protein kinase, partial [Bradymonadaceae bacterium]